MSVASRRAKTRAATVAEWRVARRGSGVGFTDANLSAARMVLRDHYGKLAADLSFENLTIEDAAELIRLVGKATVEEPRPEPYRDDPARVEAFAQRALELAEKAWWPGGGDKLKVAAAYATRTGTVPLMNGSEIVPRPEAGSAGGPKLNPAQLGADLAAFERLVELTIGRPGYFAESRARAAGDAEIAELSSRVLRVWPRKRRLFAEPGEVSIPAGVWEDLLRSDGNGVLLQVEDLGTLVSVLGALESRKLPALDVARGLMRLEDHDNTLVLVKGLGPSSPWGSLGDLDGLMAGRLPKSLKRLAHCKWIELRETAEETRISRGPRMLKHLEKRGEAGS